MELTQKQTAFTILAFQTNEPALAYLKIYKCKSKGVASACATRLLKNAKVKAFLDELNEEAKTAKVMDVTERKERLSEIARAVIPDFVENGLIKVERESPNVGAVSEVTTVTKIFRKGDSPVNITNLKLHSPLQAISELNKMERIYEEGTTVNIDNRKIEIIVTSDNAKQLTEKIIQGIGTKKE